MGGHKIIFSSKYTWNFFRNYSIRKCYFIGKKKLFRSDSLELSNHISLNSNYIA